MWLLALCTCALLLWRQCEASSQNATISLDGGSGSGGGISVPVMLSSSSGMGPLMPLTFSVTAAGGSTVQVQPTTTSFGFTELPSSPALPGPSATPSPLLRTNVRVDLAQEITFESLSARADIIGNLTESMAAIFNVSDEQVVDVLLLLVARSRRQNGGSFNTVSFTILSSDAASQQQLQNSVPIIQQMIAAGNVTLQITDTMAVRVLSLFEVVTTTSPSPTTSPSLPPPSRGLSSGEVTGLIIGLLVACLLFLLLAITGAYCFWKRRRQRDKTGSYSIEMTSPAIDTTIKNEYVPVATAGGKETGGEEEVTVAEWKSEYRYD